MSGVINVIGRFIGADDISFGSNSFVYVDVNGTPRRVNQVNAGSIPWLALPNIKLEALVDGSKNLPVGASGLIVVNTSIFSGPVYGSGTTSGYIKNYASGLFLYGQSIATGDIPSGIPATNIGSGTVSNTAFGYIANLTSDVQSQIDSLGSGLTSIGRIQYFQPRAMPRVTWEGNQTAVINATSSAPAMVCMNGFPDITNPDQFVTAGLTNGFYYEVTSATKLILPNNLWGDEKVSQWYAILANCASAAAPLSSYDLNGMPYLRCLSEASQVIKCGTNLSASVAVDYNFTANEFATGKIYVLTGAQAGQLRSITANGLTAGSSTITYSGTALTLTQGDWFIILPPGLNFRWLGDVFNDSANHFTKIDNLVEGQPHYLFTAFISNWFVPLAPCWSTSLVTPINQDGTIGTANGAGVAIKYPLVTTQGAVYQVTANTATGNSFIDALLNLSSGSFILIERSSSAVA